MAQIDIDIEDYLDEVKTEYLISELLKRKNKSKAFKECWEECDTDDLIEEVKSRFEGGGILKLLRSILNLRAYDDKKRIIEEIIAL
jgi:hypothetical protein